MDNEKGETARFYKRYSLSNSIGSSPMTNLALNLEESARLRDTPKRRISWSNESSFASPALPDLISIKSEDLSSTSSPMTCSPVFTVTLPDESLLKKDDFDRITFKSTPILRTRSLHINSSNVINKENIAKRNSINRTAINDCYDSSSRDSGFSEKQEEYSSDFIFTEPVGLPPRRGSRLLSGESPHSSFYSLESEGSNQSDDDGFLDEIDSNSDSNSNDVPSEFAQLIKGKLASNSTSSNSEEIFVSRPPLHNLCSNVDTPKAKSCIRGLFGATKLNFENVSEKKTLVKRTEHPRDSPSPVQCKRRKNGNGYQRSESAGMMDELKVIPKKSPLQRAFSETHADIMRAVQKSVLEPNLIGDCSKPYILPLIEGRHQDLKMVSHETVKSLLSGKYDDVAKYVIVDCRYPYEYDGGHIKNAVNAYTKEGIVNQFLCNPIKSEESSKRLIIIFHCEFSSERAPNLSRFLRNRDRVANKECYPQLYYPEIYVIEGGYKLFFQHNRELCEPQSYLPMVHKDYENALRHFRAKSKSWNGEKGNLRYGGRPTGLNI